MRVIFSILIMLWTVNVWAQEEPFIYNDNGKRDPLWELVSVGGVINNYETDLLLSDLNLEGIMAGDASGSLAIINGRVVQENDTIGQFIIYMIDSNYVIVMKGQEEYKLWLKKED